MKTRLVIGAIVILLFTPFWMWLAWMFSDARPLAMLVIDKTSTTAQGLERSSLFWVLRHEKIATPSGRLYSSSEDFLGFRPDSNRRYQINGPEHFGESALDSLSRQYHCLYFVDTYGITASEWNGTASAGGSRLLYGGLSRQDLMLLRAFRRDRKPVLAEFNFFADPTPDSIRQEAEGILGVRWSGWVGHSFASLDTAANPELPSWMITLHKEQYFGSWPYTRGGIVLVHRSGRIVVLENETHLLSPVPLLESSREMRTRFGTAQRVRYPYWFDIVYAVRPNRVLARYTLETTDVGDTLLAYAHLPRRFAAVIAAPDSTPFFYFAGDYADNPPQSRLLASLSGIELFRAFFFNRQDPFDQRMFFWEFYVPLMSTLVNDVCESYTSGTVPPAR
jgi:hypothetical protein